MTEARTWETESERASREAKGGATSLVVYSPVTISYSRGLKTKRSETSTSVTAGGGRPNDLATSSAFSAVYTPPKPPPSTPTRMLALVLAAALTARPPPLRMRHLAARIALETLFGTSRQENRYSERTVRSDNEESAPCAYSAREITPSKRAVDPSSCYVASAALILASLSTQSVHTSMLLHCICSSFDHRVLSTQAVDFMTLLHRICNCRDPRFPRDKCTTCSNEPECL